MKNIGTGRHIFDFAYLKQPHQLLVRKAGEEGNEPQLFERFAERIGYALDRTGERSGHRIFQRDFDATDVEGLGDEAIHAGLPAPSDGFLVELIGNQHPLRFGATGLLTHVLDDVIDFTFTGILVDQDHADGPFGKEFGNASRRTHLAHRIHHIRSTERGLHAKSADGIRIDYQGVQSSRHLSRGIGCDQGIGVCHDLPFGALSCVGNGGVPRGTYTNTKYSIVIQNSPLGE